MKDTIDIDSWDRREHFQLFMRSDLPFYNVNFNLCVDGFIERCKQNGLSVNNALVHATIRSMTSIENFLYRIEDDTVVKYHALTPSFACLRTGETLFRMVSVDFHDDIALFDARAKEAVAQSSGYFDGVAMHDRSNSVFISPMPWLPFTGVDHTLSLRKEDSIPRVTWGKIHKCASEWILPYNIQVNHALIDGLHVGMFYEQISTEMQSFVDA